MLQECILAGTGDVTVYRAECFLVLLVALGGFDKLFYQRLWITHIYLAFAITAWTTSVIVTTASISVVCFGVYARPTAVDTLASHKVPRRRIALLFLP
jgi:hypothetical protein